MGDGGSRKESNKWWRAGCHVTLFLLAALVFVLSVFMLFWGYRAGIFDLIKPHLEVRNGSDSYEVWRATPVPLLLKLYFFNLTNPDQFLLGARPNLQELGPYVWREHHEKVNITFHDNATVTYYQRRWWEWDQEASGPRSTDDELIMINPIYVGAVHMMQGMFLKGIALDLFKNLSEPFIVHANVGSVLFDGVNDPWLEWLQENVVSDRGIFHIIMYFVDFSDMLKYDKFAWFYKRNMSAEYDGLYNMRTGTDSLSNLGLIDWWNYKRATKYYGAPCNQVSGSAGELFPPGQDQTTPITFFSSDLCMTAELYFKEEMVDQGLRVFRYWGSNHTFANSSVVPGRECFCVDGTCAPTGLLNAESCRMGAPAFISFPHFLHADPFLLDGVVGLQPNESKHAFFIDLIPDLGLPTKVAARLQINLRIQPDSYFPQLSKLTEVYLPLLWFEAVAELTPEMSDQLKPLQFVLSWPLTYLLWIVLLVLSILAIVLLMIVNARQQLPPHTQP